MNMGSGALVLMAGGFAAGAGLAVLTASPRGARVVTLLGAIAGCIGGLAAAATVIATGRPVVAQLPGLVSSAGGIVIGLDLLGALFLTLVSAVGLLAAIYGAGYTAAYEGRHSLQLFGLMFNGFLLGMSLVACAANIFTFVLAWELMAVTSYFLVMTESESRDTREAGLWYAAMAHFALVLILPMFLLMAPAADATTFGDLRIGARALPALTRDGVFLLALMAFGSKAGIVPLHVWLPRAHPAAPSHVSALMSGVMIKLGIYGFLRVTVDFLGPGPAWWGGLVLLAGSLSALGGVLYALTDNDLKRLLAYSSVENIGVIFLGIGAGLVLQSYGLPTLALVGFGAALLHTVNHACFKALLFFAAGNVLHQTHTRNMEELGGLVKGMPQTATMFLIGSAAAAALPPLNGFASEWMVFQALLSGAQTPQPGSAIGTPLAVGVLALTSGLAAACFVKAFGITFLAMPRSEHAASARESHWSARAVMGVLAGGCVVLGLAAPRAIDWMYRIVSAVSSLPRSAPASAGANVWLMAPNGIAQVSPVLIALLLTSVMVVVAAAIRARGFTLRYADTWGCGRVRQTSRMEYTSSAFAEPLRRIFSELYRPTEDLSISVIRSRGISSARSRTRARSCRGSRRPSTIRSRASFGCWPPGSGACRRDPSTCICSTWQRLWSWRSARPGGFDEPSDRDWSADARRRGPRADACRLHPLVEGAIAEPTRGPAVAAVLRDLQAVRQGSRRVAYRVVDLQGDAFVVFGTGVAVASLVPLILVPSGPFVIGDLFAVVYLLLLGTFFLALAGLDTGSPFGGMGASREMTVVALTEPTVALSIVALALQAGSTSFSQIVARTIAEPTMALGPGHLMAFAALFIVTLAETGRLPVDNPSTHLELTMIHEAMVLEYSGPYLALLEWGAALKLLVFLALAANLFMPWGIAESLSPAALTVGAVSVVVKLGILAVAIAVLETRVAKLRLFRVPELLSASFVLALLAVMTTFLAR